VLLFEAERNWVNFNWCPESEQFDKLGDARRNRTANVQGEFIIYAIICAGEYNHVKAAQQKTSMLLYVRETFRHNAPNVVTLAVIK
jgi:hypothetical protein